MTTASAITVTASGAPDAPAAKPVRTIPPDALAPGMVNQLHNTTSDAHPNRTVGFSRRSKGHKHSGQARVASPMPGHDSSGTAESKTSVCDHPGFKACVTSESDRNLFLSGDALQTVVSTTIQGKHVAKALW